MPEQTRNEKLLIVGSGPTGLALAVELVRRGYRPDLIDRASGPTPVHESRALAINQRTLDLLKPSGVAGSMIEVGYPIKQAQFHWNDKPLVRLQISDYAKNNATLLTIPQGTSEAIMLNWLAEREIAPKWDHTLTNLSDLENSPLATITPAEGPQYHDSYDYVFGCDGAHSKVREKASISFKGLNSPDQWSLVDIEYEKDFSDHTVNAFLAPGSARARIPVNDHTLRLISNNPDVEDKTPFPQHQKSTPWKSEFKISYRMVERFSIGRIFLCGDSAHVHSPAGGRGMNLGIEDGAWLAWLMSRGELHRYNKLRMKAAKHVLAQTRAQTRLITGKIPGASLLVPILFPLLVKVPFVRNQIIINMLGLDTKKPEWL